MAGLGATYGGYHATRGRRIATMYELFTSTTLYLDQIKLLFQAKISSIINQTA